MKWHLLFLLLMGMNWHSVHSTCVFESDFGFTLNCGFKKSSIFRIRNLGGVKSYFGLGFSVGDELGFKESLSNVESANRRSVDSARSASGYFQQLLTSSTTQRSTPKVGENATGAASASQARSLNGRATQLRTAGYRGASGPGGMNVKFGGPLVTGLVPVTIPPFKPIQPSKVTRPVRLTKDEDTEEMSPTVIAVPAFAALPDSVAKVPTFNVKRNTAQSHFQNMLQNANRRFSVGNIQGANEGELSNSISSSPQKAPSYQAVQDPLFPEAVGQALKSVSQGSNVSADALLASIQLRQHQLLMQHQKQLATSHKLQSTPTQLMPVYTTASSTSTTTTSTSTSTTILPPIQIIMESTTVKPAPTPLRQAYTMAGSHKVMNAPKEYYPVGYDKNFDDNFTSKVELPDTSFSCGDQKHFPGLYADEDLNCMVFHVCALTDDGLVMKSFLCPESTLFDQTILKCNWWFYVDCKSSKKLYDSNIPISKSYQLMKALAFFSSYSKNTDQIQAGTVSANSSTNQTSSNGSSGFGTFFENVDSTKR